MAVNWSTRFAKFLVCGALIFDVKITQNDNISVFLWSISSDSTGAFSAIEGTANAVGITITTGGARAATVYRGVTKVFTCTLG